MRCRTVAATCGEQRSCAASSPTYTTRSSSSRTATDMVLSRVSSYARRSFAASRRSTGSSCVRNARTSEGSSGGASLARQTRSSRATDGDARGRYSPTADATATPSDDRYPTNRSRRAPSGDTSSATRSCGTADIPLRVTTRRISAWSRRETENNIASGSAASTSTHTCSMVSVCSVGAASSKSSSISNDCERSAVITARVMLSPTTFSSSAMAITRDGSQGKRAS